MDYDFSKLWREQGVPHKRTRAFCEVDRIAYIAAMQVAA